MLSIRAVIFLNIYLYILHIESILINWYDKLFIDNENLEKLRYIDSVDLKTSTSITEINGIS